MVIIQSHNLFHLNSVMAALKRLADSELFAPSSRKAREAWLEVDKEERAREAWFGASAASKAAFLAKLWMKGVTPADIYTKFETDDRFFYTMCGMFPANGNPDATALNTRWRFFTDEKFDLDEFDNLDQEAFEGYTILREHPLKIENFWDALDRIYDGKVDPTTVSIDYTQDYENADDLDADLGDDYKRLCRIAKLYPAL